MCKYTYRYALRIIALLVRKSHIIDHQEAIKQKILPLGQDSVDQQGLILIPPSLASALPSEGPARWKKAYLKTDRQLEKNY